MASYLEVANGRYAGSTLAVTDGQAARVGSLWGLELALDDDPDLPQEAFAINAFPHHAELFTLTGPTLKNGEPIVNATLQHGDWILSGRTLFRYTRSGASSFHGHPDTPLDWLRVELLSRPDYLLWLDLADETSMRRRLEASCPCLPWAQSLPEERALGGAPWLVAPGLRPGLLNELLHEFWPTQRMQILWSSTDLTHTLEAFRSINVFRAWRDEVVALRFWDPRFWQILQAEGQSPAFLAGPSTEIWMPTHLPAELSRWQGDGQDRRHTVQWIGWDDRRILALWEVEAALRSSALPLLEAAAALVPSCTNLEETLRRAAALGFSSPAAAVQYALLSAHYDQPIERIPAVQQFTQRLGLSLPAAMDQLVLTLNQRLGHA